MSTSAIIAARKRIETSLRNYDLPADKEPQSSTIVHENAKNGSLLLSLLQSRLNWMHSVFVKYRADTTQQIRRAPNTRKKWPNMRYLGTCTVELGTHLFHDTAFYEAVRTEPWSALAEAAGHPIPNIAMQDDNSNNNNKSNQDTNDNDVVMEEKDGNNATIDHHRKELVYSDIVMEFKEVPGERVLFPKDIIVQVTSVPAPFELMGSFLLPLDPHVADDFFLDPKEKLKRWGKDSNIPEVRDLADLLNKTRSKSASPPPPAPPSESCQPVNMRLRNVDAELLHAILSNVHPAEKVRDEMVVRMKQATPNRSYLQHSEPSSDKSIEELIQKANTVPEIVSGPVLAEKKRNELLNAIRLGKRPRSDQPDEASPSKGKQAAVKDDGIRRCLYCSTKVTAMWRRGPEGGGTLCNGCGLLWEQGKILKGAPVISKEEERQRLREQWEKARELHEEKERERELQRQKQEATKAVKTEKASKVGLYAAQILQASTPTSTSQKTISPIQPAPTTTTTTITTTSTSDIHPPPPTTEPKKERPSLLYNSQQGIQLPTLAIHFTPSLTFAHPNCSVTLMDSCFSIRLAREGYESATFEISKKHLQESQFDLCEDGSGTTMQLTMTCIPTGGSSVHLFDTDLLIPNDPSHKMAIKFLEKMDPNEGAVVKRILQKWLETPTLSDCT